MSGQRPWCGGSRRDAAAPQDGAAVYADRMLHKGAVASAVWGLVRGSSAVTACEQRRNHNIHYHRVARLEISNSGAIMTREEAASLTEPFRRLGAARTGDGLGLGLSIAASVAKAHGGQLAISA